MLALTGGVLVQRALSNFTGNVDLVVSGIPIGASGTLNRINVAAPSAATLVVATAGNTPEGTCTLTIMGTSGSIHHATSVILVVRR